MRLVFGSRLLVIALLCVTCAAAFAQEELTSDQLRRMYDDALAQLKTAQDRRNELARENQKLLTRLSQLEERIQAGEAELNDLMDKTFQARSIAAMLHDFLRENPYCRMQWDAFREKNLLARPDKSWLDPDWPLPPNR